MALFRKLAAGGSLAVAAHAAACDKWQATLRLHNLFRCMHGMDDLVWDADIAAAAQAWADQGVYDHAMEGTRFRANGVGENLGMASYQQYDGAAATKTWYEQVLYTPLERYGKPLSPSDHNPTFPTETIGSYTAMIWKNATKLGCGQGTLGNDYVVIVCQYGTDDGGMAPNTVTPEGLFADPDQVAGPSRTYAECAAKCPDRCEKYVPEPRTCVPGKIPSVEASQGRPPVEPANSIVYCKALLHPWSVYGKNDCIPNQRLPNFSPCAHGYQCESNTCSPLYRVCVNSVFDFLGEQWSLDDLNIANAAKKAELENIITGTCSDAGVKPFNCADSSGPKGRNGYNYFAHGSPIASWDQSQCGCSPEYMAYYDAGTWVAQNDNVPGLVCINSQDFTCTRIEGEFAFPGSDTNVLPGPANDGAAEDAPGAAEDAPGAAEDAPGAAEDAPISGCERRVVLASIAVTATTLLLQALH